MGPDDAANATRRVRGDLPGQDKEAKKAAEEGYEAVRATAQDYVRHASTRWYHQKGHLNLY